MAAGARSATSSRQRLSVGLARAAIAHRRTSHAGHLPKGTSDVSKSTFPASSSSQAGSPVHFAPGAPLTAVADRTVGRSAGAGRHLFRHAGRRCGRQPGSPADDHRALQDVQSEVNLPLINQPLQKVTQITTSLETFQSALASALHNLKPGTADSDIKEAIFDAIGPDSSVNVLQPHADGSPAVRSDVSVTTNPSTGGFDVSLNLGYQTNEVNAPAGLGINSIPFQPAAGTNGSFVVGVSYQHFDFGYNPTSGPYFGTDANSQLQLTFTGNLPQTFTAGLGFMNVTVTQNPTPQGQPVTPDLALTISSQLSGGIGNNQGTLGISDPTLSGALHLDKHFLVQVSGKGMPGAPRQPGVGLDLA